MHIFLAFIIPYSKITDCKYEITYRENEILFMNNICKDYSFIPKTNIIFYLGPTEKERIFCENLRDENHCAAFDLETSKVGIQKSIDNIQYIIRTNKQLIKAENIAKLTLFLHANHKPNASDGESQLEKDVMQQISCKLFSLKGKNNPVIKTGDEIKNEKAKLIFLARDRSNFSVFPQELVFKIAHLSLLFSQKPIHGKYTKPVIAELPKKKSGNCLIQ